MAKLQMICWSVEHSPDRSLIGEQQARTCHEAPKTPIYNIFISTLRIKSGSKSVSTPSQSPSSNACTYHIILSWLLQLLIHYCLNEMKSFNSLQKCANKQMAGIRRLLPPKPNSGCWGRLQHLHETGNLLDTAGHRGLSETKQSSSGEEMWCSGASLPNFHARFLHIASFCHTRLVYGKFLSFMLSLTLG